jgi:PAS domain-containing protein
MVATCARIPGHRGHGQDSGPLNRVARIATAEARLVPDKTDMNVHSAAARCTPRSSREPATYFAPAGRDSPSEIRRKAAAVQEVPLLRQALDAMPTMVMILNANRQIVAANATLLNVLDKTIAEVVQRRPGEAVGCIRSAKGPDGCGTAEHCATCGAVQAVLESQKEEQKVVRECRILIETPEGAAPMDLRVTATPFRVKDDCFIMAALEDISQAKRLAILQRTFFHDVLNTAGCIRGFVQYLVGEEPVDLEVRETLSELAERLVEAIGAQRDLVQAEVGDLQIQPVALPVRAVLDELRLQYSKHSAAAGRTIRLGHVWNGVLVTDRQLLCRVLGNMLKNALEATAPGGTVTMDCQERHEGVMFSVHNAEVMPTEVRLQVFQRSFSTKGEPGRGIGTYSMKLFGERYLQGKVDFVSQMPDGTRFLLTVPKRVL